MLRIERMEVVGFKSFPDRTVIEFPDGITAVVGPNGCGKSNIADAIQWVLGEQSARALRGQRMEDVIFAGSEGRGPGGMAEVTLSMVARNQPLPDGKTHVTLTRRLFRTGDSEYLVDGRQGRLLDIRNLLEQVRAGERTYAIIDQSRVASFVISRPKERRMFIEDAAGISGYKQRRRLAEMKLEGTRANLLRVDDILREVERQRRSLQRQAALARRARRLETELRELKTLWFRRRARVLDGRAQELNEVAAVAQREAAHLDRERARLAHAAAEARGALDAARDERERLVARAHQARLDEERLAAEIEAALARAAALEDEAGRQENEGKRLALDRTLRQAERDSVTRDLSELAERIVALEHEVEAARLRADGERDGYRELQQRAEATERELYERMHERAEVFARLSAAREAHQREADRVAESAAAAARLEAARADAERQLEDARQAMVRAEQESARLAEAVQQARRAEDDAAQRLEQARAAEAAVGNELGSREGEKAALDSLAVRLAGADPAREVLERAAERDLAAHGVAADALVVEREFERAAEAFLAELLPTVIVESAQDVLKGAALGVRGRVQFLPLDAVGGHDAGPGLPDELAADPRVRGRLAAHVAARAGLEAVGARVRDAVLVDDLAAALELQRRFPGWNYVTPAGDAVLSSGVVAVHGGPEDGEGLLARTRRREELAASVAQLAAARSAALDELERARQEHQAGRAAREGAEAELAEGRRAHTSAQMAWEQGGRELARIVREAALVAGVHEAAERAREEAARRAAALEAQLQQIEGAIASGREALDAARATAHEREDTVRQAASALAALSADLRAQEERRAALARDDERLARDLAEIGERSERGLVAGRRAADEAQTLRAQADLRRGDLERVRAERAAAEAEVARRAETLSAASAAARALDARVDTAAQELEDARARREQHGLELERARLELEHIVGACREELGCLPEELPADAGSAGTAAELAGDEVLAARVAEVRDKRDRLGLVNPLAEQEFDELSARATELTGQKEDLEKSIEEMNNSIKKMDRESRERFLDALGSIRRHFREQFAILFRGGRADLILEDENDPLESGIEILCQPPGKKLQAVTLLSGGEKALAATAVLFAIFSYQAPPFCLLDEVDAPLDEANVGRFADALRTFTDRTQFILITHNKRSMEMADLLYGVTMPEPGVSRLVSMSLD